MKIEILYVKGMHCNACKLLVENALLQLPYLQTVNANVKKGTIQLGYEHTINQEEIANLIRECGYEVVAAPIIRPWLSRNVKDWKIATISLLSFLFLYFVLRHMGVFSGAITSSSSPSLGLVLLIGLTAGFSSCMAVVGGLVLAISSKRNQTTQEQSFGKKIVPHFWFNAGRIVGFAVFGGILGFLGQAISLSPFMMSVMIFIVGIVMFLLGVNVSQLSPKLSSLSLSLPVGKWFTAGEADLLKGKQRGWRTYLGVIGGGALTFFLPCGFTFAMQLYAMSTGSFWMGALVMLLFAVGTLPGLLGVGSLTSIFKGKAAKICYQVIGMLVILLGLYNIASSYGVIKATLSSGQPSCDELTGVCVLGGEDSVSERETIQMTYTTNGLRPSVVNLELGKQYTLEIDVQTTVYGCMSTIYLPGLDSTMQSLKAGTVVTFTVSPTKAGTYAFVCAMGDSHGAKVVVS